MVHLAIAIAAGIVLGYYALVGIEQWRQRRSWKKMARHLRQFYEPPPSPKPWPPPADLFCYVVGGAFWAALAYGVVGLAFNLI